MPLEGVSLLWRKFVQKVPLYGHHLFGFSVIHRISQADPIHKNGDSAFPGVSIFRRIKFPTDSSQILGFKVLFCTVQQHAQIFPVYPELPANLLPIPFVEKDSLQQHSIPGRHVEEDLPHLDLDLA